MNYENKHNISSKNGSEWFDVSTFYGYQSSKKHQKLARQKILDKIKDNLRISDPINVTTDTPDTPVTFSKTKNRPRPRGRFKLGSYYSRNRKRDYVSRKAKSTITCPYCSRTIDQNKINNTETERIEKNYVDASTQVESDLPKISAMGREFIEMLDNRTIIIPLIANLERGDCLEDFMLLIRNLSTGRLPVTNIAFLLLLDRSNVLQYKTTTNMRYKLQCKKFWACVYSICKGAGIRLFSGPKNLGSIVTGVATRGNFIPDYAVMNFCVPDEKVLRESVVGLPKRIDPGILPQALDSLKKEKEYILTFDGKKIASGLHGTSLGDINLWGNEQGSSIGEELERLDKEITNVKFLETDQPISVSIFNLTYCLKINSVRIRDVRVKLSRQKFVRERLMTLQSRNPDNVNKYKYAISGIDAHEYTCRQWIEKVLAMNQHICEVLARLRCNSAFFSKDDKCWDNLINVHRLESPDVAAFYFDTDVHTNLVKQRTNKWWSIRDKCKVTGSTAHNSIGLRTLKDQRNHYNKVVLGVNTETFTEEQKVYMQHGQENEINALTTLMCTVVPALKPGCSRYIEQGAFVLDGECQKNLMAVSPDGLLCCSRPNQTCLDCVNPDAEKICIEVKCPYPKDGSEVKHHYTLPVYYTVQILAELHATKSEKAWLVSYGPESTVILEIQFESETWNTVWQEISTLYDVQCIQKPNKLSPRIKSLKTLLAQYAEKNTRIVAEVPSLKHKIEVERQAIHQGPYLIHDNNNHTNGQCDSDLKLQDDLSKISQQVQELILEAHDLTRNKATELLAFVISDTDRFSNPDVPHNLPVAYALKGNSLPIATLRNLVDRVRDILLERKIHVLCECMDGQFINMVTKDKEGEPLTKLQLQKSVWYGVCKMRKATIIEELCQISSVSQESLNTLQAFRKNEAGVYEFGNLVLAIQNNTSYKLYSNGGGLYDGGMIGIIHTTGHKKSWAANRKQIHKTKINEMPMELRTLTHADVVEIVHEELDTICSNMQTDPVESEEQKLTNYCINEMVQSIIDINLEEDILMEDQTDEVDTIVQLEEEKCDQENMLLSSILLQLQASARKARWMDVSEKSLFEDYLNSAENIDKSFTSKELDIIAQILLDKTGVRPFKPSEKKHLKTNVLSYLFGDSSQKVMTRRKKNIPKLQNLCKSFISKHTYPKQVLCVALSTCRMKKASKDWHNKATVPMNITIHGNRDHDCYSYPELSKSRGQIEPRTIDATHILTNLRTHATQKGFVGVDKTAFIRAAETDDSIISKIIIERNLDQQNASYAKSIFSLEFAAVMSRNGDHKEAAFVRLVHNWYAACDMRGIPSIQRMHYLLDFYDYLIEGVDFGHFPPYTQYIKGFPVVMFESIMQNISTRLQLYALSIFGTYNHRALSTLDIENLFSLLSRLAVSHTGCPKAINLPLIMSRVTRLNIIRQDTDRGFAADLTRKSVYPSGALQKKNATNEELKQLGQYETVHGTSQVTIRDHLFDTELQPNKRKRKNGDSQISGIFKTPKLEQGVRFHFKVFESNISPMAKCRL